MNRLTLYTWSVTATALGVALGWFIATSDAGLPSIGAFLFWSGLIAAVQLLPVTLGFGGEVTMGFPLTLAIAIVFRDQPWIAMSIAGISAIDLRELRRQIPLHRALFNRAELMLSVGAAASLFHFLGGSALSLHGVIIGAVTHVMVNLGLVSAVISLHQGIPWSQAARELPPRPISGFFISYGILTGLGAVTALVNREIDEWAVAAILIPLLFARLSIMGARAQQELSEKVRRQQEALLQATERVFEERERERKRIAEDIHDSSLQLLAAAAYGCGNASELLGAGREEAARQAVAAAREAIEGSMAGLRESISALRKSSVEEGGLMETIRKFAEQSSTLWNVDISIEGEIESEPPVPVALAAFQIFQEGLTNALKHSQSKAIAVTIIEEEGLVHIVVQDEGAGFDPSEEVGEEHVGMRLMNERAARVGGRIELDSKPGAGTRLEAILPAGVAR